LELVKVVVSILGFGGTIVTLALALWQFGRAEQWRRAEFLAREMKDFFADRNVQNALLMIDWGTRRIELYGKDGSKAEGSVVVTRKLQIAALRPHTIVSGSDDSDAEAESTGGEVQAGSRLRAFTPDQARIRDSYDAFLDGLERFGSFLRGDLVTREQLRAYIGYWIRGLSTPSTDQADIDWQCVLLAYVDFYRFTDVQYLFSCLEASIGAQSDLFRKLLTRMSDRDLAVALEEALRQRAA
jgi:hypothetical protein